MNTPNMLNAAKRASETKYIYENRIKQNLFPGKTYYIRTYGCQMNVHDTEEIKGLLESVGFTENSNLNKNDLIIDRKSVV